MRTTGEIASAAAVSEKAVRLYADRDLLRAKRGAGGRRLFDESQLHRAKLIALLRGLDISLGEVGLILDAADPVGAFDRVWGAYRADDEIASAASEYVRGRLGGACVLPAGLGTQPRDVPERVLLTVPGRATLPEMSTVVPELTSCIFSYLTEQDVPLDGPIHLEVRSRASETYPAELLLCAPIPTPIRPGPGMAIILDPSHREVFVSLTQEAADDQRLIVAVHDFLSTAHGETSASPRVGPNREVYLPSFGTGAPGVVMEIAIPVRAVEREGSVGVT